MSVFIVFTWTQGQLNVQQGGPLLNYGNHIQSFYTYFKLYDLYCKVWRANLKIFYRLSQLGSGIVTFL